VVAEPIGLVARGRRARIAEAAPRDAVNMVSRDQLASELVEYMRRVSQSRKHHQWLPCPAPIEHFQLYVFVDRHKLNIMRGRIVEFCLLGGAPQLKRQRLELGPCAC